MIDPTHETIVPRHTENKVAQAVGDLIVLASYEAIFGIGLYAFAYVILNDLQIDALPPFTVNNFPIFRGIGITFIALGIVHFVYSIAFNWCYSFKACRIVGFFLGAVSIPIIPTGTFFGMLFLADMNKIHNSSTPLAVDIPPYDKNEVGIIIKTNALVMAHLPIFFYYLYYYLLTIQSDILYPNFRMGVINAMKIFAFVYGGIYILQLLVGLIFRFYGEKHWEQIILLVFIIFNVICIAIVLQTYIWLNWGAFGFEGYMKVVGNLFWIIGILVNPIGLFFAAHYIRLFRQSRVYHARKSAAKIQTKK